MGDEQKNKEIVRKVEQLWIDGKLDQLDQYFGTGDHSHDRPPFLPQGLAGAKMAHQGAKKSFPDRKLEIKDIIAEGDKVFVRSAFSATYMGGVPGIDVPAGGKRVENIDSWSVYRLKDGKIVEHWGINDGFAIAMQVGAIKMPAMPVGAG
jgi:predicted ester cyclase